MQHVSAGSEGDHFVSNAAAGRRCRVQMAQSGQVEHDARGIRQAAPASQRTRRSTDRLSLHFWPLAGTNTENGDDKIIAGREVKWLGVMTTVETVLDEDRELAADEWKLW